MISTPTLIFACVVALAGAFVQDDESQESPESFEVVTTSRTPVNWIRFLQASNGNWKFISGNYGKITIELQKRGYPLNIIEPYSKEGLGVAEKCLENYLANYSSPELTTAIKKHWKDALAIYPNDEWNVKLVDNVIAEFEKFFPKTDDAAAMNDRAYNIVLGLTNSLKVIICWREYVEENMKNPEIKGDDGFLYKCANRIYQGVIRKFYGPCTVVPPTTVAPTTEASIDNTTAPYVGFWTKCLEGCAEKFENKN